jgi:hypothetical protein
LIDLLGVSTGFVESFAKSQGITNFSNIAKKLSGILIIFAGVYLRHRHMFSPRMGTAGVICCNS